MTDMPQCKLSSIFLALGTFMLLAGAGLVAAAECAITAPANHTNVYEGTVLVSGTASGGAAVRVRVDGNLAGSPAVISGTWSLSVVGLDGGPHQVTAVVVDPDPVSPTVQVAFAVRVHPQRKRTVIARSGDLGLTGMGDQVSINRSGTVAFVGQFADGEGVMVGDGVTLRNLAPSFRSSDRVFGRWVQIIDDGQVLARDRVSGSPPATLLRLWSSAGGVTNQFDLVARDDTPFELGSFRAIASVMPFATCNNQGLVMFQALWKNRLTLGEQLQSSTLILYRNQDGIYSGGSATIPRPLLADSLATIFRLDSKAGAPVAMALSPMAATSARSVQGFSACGIAPGISDDGEVGVFVGERGHGKGIFLVRRPAGGDPMVTPLFGENSEVMKAELGYGATGQVIGFSDFDGDQRVGIVNHAQFPAGFSGDRVVVCFVATPSDAKVNNEESFLIGPGLWTASFVMEGEVPRLVSGPTLLSQFGDAIDPDHNDVSPITAIRLYDPITTTDGGDAIAYWSQAAGRQLVVRQDIAAASVTCYGVAVDPRFAYADDRAGNELMDLVHKPLAFPANSARIQGWFGAGADAFVKPIQYLCADEVTPALIRLTAPAGRYQLAFSGDGASALPTGHLARLVGGSWQTMTPGTEFTLDSSGQTFFQIKPLSASHLALHNSTALALHLGVVAQGKEIASSDLGLSLPPILLVHGHWADSTTWGLGDPASGVSQLVQARPAGLVSAIDYPAPHLGAPTAEYSKLWGFSQLRPHLHEAILAQVAKWRSAGIGFTRPDVVAHSQGGVLMTMLCEPQGGAYPYQRNQDWFRGRFGRIVTIGTPHQGCRLAAYLLRLGTDISDIDAGDPPLVHFRRAAAFLAVIGQIVHTKFDPIEGEIRDLNDLLDASGGVTPRATDPNSRFNFLCTRASATANVAEAVLLFRNPLAFTRVIPVGFDGVMDRDSTVGPHVDWPSVVRPLAVTDRESPETLHISQTKSSMVLYEARRLLGTPLFQSGDPLFMPFVARMQLADQISQDIDDSLPPLDVQDLIRFVVEQSSGAARAATSEPIAKAVTPARVVTVRITPAAGDAPASAVVWRAYANAVGGTSTEGISVTPGSGLALTATITVAPAVVGDVLVTGWYFTADGRMIFLDPQRVLAGSLGPLTGIALTGVAEALTVGDYQTAGIDGVYATGRAPLILTAGSTLAITSADPTVVRITGSRVIAVAAGSAVLTASTGGFTTTLTVTVLAAQQVVITAPAPNAVLPLGDLVISATASANDGSDQVEFFVDGDSAGLGYGPTPVISWSATPGQHVISAVATHAGLLVSSAPLRIHVRDGVADRAPRLGIFGGNADVVSLSPTIRLRGWSSDDAAGVQVRWRTDHGGSGTATGADEWSASGIPLITGTTVVTVIARDSAAHETSTTLRVGYSAIVPLELSAPLSPGRDSPLVFLVDGAEPVTGLAVDDATVVNGTVAGIEGSGASYRVLVTPTGDGVVGLTLRAGAASAVSGRTTPAVSAEVTSDRTPPTATLALVAGTTEVRQFTLTFSEPVPGLMLDDVVLTNAVPVALSGSGTSYALSVRPQAQGTFTATLPVGSCRDAAGNPLAVAASANGVLNVPPRVSIIPPGAESDEASIVFTCVFSEAVHDFIAADCVVTNGHITSFTPTDSSVFTITVQADAAGTVRLAIPAGCCLDAAATPLQDGADAQVAYLPSPPGFKLSSLPREGIWHPDVAPSAIAVKDDVAYIAGGFSMVGPTRLGLAFNDVITGAVADMPFPMPGSHPLSGFPAVSAITYLDDHWYVGGAFSRTGTIKHSQLARFDRAMRLDETWRPKLVYDEAGQAELGDFRARMYEQVIAMASDGPNLWVVSSVLQVENAGYPRLHFHEIIYRFSLSDGSGGEIGRTGERIGTPSIARLTVSNDLVYLVGNFVELPSRNGPLSYAVAYDRRTRLVSSWNPQLDAPARALAVVADTVYLGGDFGTVGGVSRRNLAAVRVSDAGVLPWNPRADGAVWDLVPEGSSLWCAGAFGSVGGAYRKGLALLDRASGSVGAFSADLRRESYPATEPEVHSLVATPDRLYLTGTFSSIGASQRTQVAILDRNGVVNGPDLACDGTVSALCVADGRIALGGAFTIGGGVYRDRLAAIDLGSGVATGFAPQTRITVGANQYPANITAITVVHDRVVIGGEVAYNIVDNTSYPPPAWRYFNASTGSEIQGLPVPFGRNSQGYVLGLQTLANKVYGIGYLAQSDAIYGPIESSTLVSSTLDGDPIHFLDATANPPALCALDEANGLVVLSDAANMDLRRLDLGTDRLSPVGISMAIDGLVNVAAADANTVFLGGSFRSLNHHGHRGLAALDRNTYQERIWSPPVNPAYYSGFTNLCVFGGAVVVGGNFSTTVAPVRSNLVAFDSITSDPLVWNPGLSGVQAVVPHRNYLLVGAAQQVVKADTNMLLTANFMVYGEKTRPIVQPLRLGVAVNGAISGAIAAWDGASSDLIFRVTEAPQHGTVLIDERTGAFTYTPDGTASTAPDHFFVTVRNDEQTADPVRIDIVPGGVPPTVTSPSRANATVGAAFSYRLTIAGVVDGVTVESLPSGLHFDSATGMITGTLPTAAGTYAIGFRSENSWGVGRGELLLQVMPVPTSVPQITPPLLDRPYVTGRPLVFLVPDHGDAMTFSASGLPDGMAIDPVTGVITGRPRLPGTYVVTVTATNTVGSSHITFELTIDDTRPICYLSGPDPVSRNDPLVFDVQFDQIVSPLTAAALSVTGGTIQSVAGFLTNPYRFTVVIHPTADGPLRLNVPAGAVTNLDGAENAPASITIQVDRMAPQAMTTTVVVSGTVSLDTATLRIGGLEVTPAADGSWSVEVTAPVGTIALEMEAIDRNGNRRRRTILITRAGGG